MLGLITETGQKRTSRFDLTTQFQKVLLLATKFTMEDSFFAKILEENGIEVVIPEAKEREQMKIDFFRNSRIRLNAAEWMLVI